MRATTLLSSGEIREDIVSQIIGHYNDIHYYDIYMMYEPTSGLLLCQPASEISIGYQGNSVFITASEGITAKFRIFCEGTAPLICFDAIKNSSIEASIIDFSSGTMARCSNSCDGHVKVFAQYNSLNVDT
ncbi:MAG: hypothetical protein KA998_03515, partial [Rickettsiaceae bacterium]|nr:hypothetical protein [Rickettsiaceae bacterium]